MSKESAAAVYSGEVYTASHLSREKSPKENIL
jgi:hypothetical protein